MSKYKRIIIRRLFISMLTNPIFILVYGISFYELDILCRIGKKNNNVTVLFACMLFFLVYLIAFIIMAVIKTNGEPQKDEDNARSKKVYKTVWTFAAIIIIVFVTLFYGAKIYHSSTKYNGKLAWFLKDLEDKKAVKLEHNNIYKDGIDGIFTDINNKISLPQKLYISSSFSLNFNSDGTITSFDTFIYGKNNKDKLESYLISYNSSKSDKITIYLNGYAKPTYSEDKLLDPLIKTMKVIPLKKTVENWHENKYGILYNGIRSFGYNGNGVIYIDSKGKTKPFSEPYSEIIGYVVSVYVPGKENVYTPARYILTTYLNNIKSSTSSKENSINKKTNNTDTFYSSSKVGYRLEVTAAAAGSRSYSLDQTSDGGNTWKTINEDPFSGKLGVAAGITFLNKKLGFLCLSHSGGTYGELYRTEDGGMSYSKIDFPEIKATLKSGETYNPFDLPGMPYKKDGCLDILVGQGADGDYNGGSKALYQSKDEGKTWNYIKETAGN